MVSFVKDIKEVVKRIVRNGQKRKKKGGGWVGAETNRNDPCISCFKPL